MAGRKITGFIKKLLNRWKKAGPIEEANMIPRRFTWEEIVEAMYEKELSLFILHEVVQTVYSKDKAKRYVILKSNKGFYSYVLQEIVLHEEDEWGVRGSEDNLAPAMWEGDWQAKRYSFFENTEELMKEMKAEPEYGMYFE